MLTRSQILCVGLVSLLVALSARVDAATYSLAPDPVAFMQIDLGGQSTVVDVSSRLRGSLTLEPVGPWTAVDLEVGFDGEPIVMTGLLPGVPVTYTIDVSSLSWSLPSPTQPPVTVNVVNGQSQVFFSTSVAEIEGSYRLGGLAPTPFDFSVGTLQPGSSAVLIAALDQPSASEVILGAGSVLNSPTASFQVAWLSGVLLQYQVSMRLVTGPLRFVPEPSALALGALGLTSLMGLRGWRGSSRTRRGSSADRSAR